MLLYHYSKLDFPTIMTLSAQNLVDAKEREEGIHAAKYRHDPAPYFDHISFFMDPLDLDEMGRLYKGLHHHTWAEGNTLYEYVVDMRRAKPNFLYSIIETPQEIDYMNQHWKDPMPDRLKPEYFAGLEVIRREHGYVGKGVAELEKGAAPLIGKTMSFYRKRVKNMDAEELKTYASGIPHVKIFPTDGKLKPIHPPKAKTIQSSLKVRSLQW